MTPNDPDRSDDAIVEASNSTVSDWHGQVDDRLWDPDQRTDLRSAREH